MDEGMELRIEISVSNYQQGGNMRLSEQITIKDTDFMALSLILAKFHDVLIEIKEVEARDGV